MLRIRNNLISEFSVGNVIDDGLGGYDFYNHNGDLMFTLDLDEKEFEVLAAFLGEEVQDDDEERPTGVWPKEALE